METNYTVLVIGCLKHEEIADRYFKLANIYWNDSLKIQYFVLIRLPIINVALSNNCFRNH